jgi:hypothetical protein
MLKAQISKLRMLKGHWKGPNFVIIVSTRDAKMSVPIKSPSDTKKVYVSNK